MEETKDESLRESLFGEIDSKAGETAENLSPLIGLSVNVKEGTSRISDAYVNAVLRAGGIPLLIPLTTDPVALSKIEEKIDGLILTGGGDMDASYFNERLYPGIEPIKERDTYDFSLLKLASDRQIPVLGICRGMQVINVAFGGTLWQDIPTQCPGSLVHNQETERYLPAHEIRIEPDSLLRQIIGKDKIEVNSFHHQAVKEIAKGFKAVAKSPDGIVEAIEPTNFKHIWGVQWHPEDLICHGNEEMIRLMKAFLGEASLFKKAKAIHKHILSLDSHNDTPMLFKDGIDIGLRNAETKVDLPKMREGRLDSTIMVAYLPQGKRDAESSEKAYRQAVDTIQQLQAQIAENNKTAGFARTAEDIKRLKRQGKKAILTGVENGYAVGKDIGRLKVFKDLGVSYITLSHNGHNDICDSHSEKVPEHNGLSEFGKKVVKEMNRLGIIVDISHTSEKTSFDALETSEYPIIASHSSVKALCNHTRNISDKLFHAIADKGGVVQICLYENFLKKGGNATLKDAIAHIDYAVKLVGAEHVGIGSDFDGGGGVPGIDGSNEMINITIELLKKGYSEEDLEKIWGGNFLRVLNQVQRKSNDQ